MKIIITESQYETLIDSKSGSPKKATCCSGCDCWSSCGGESYWNGEDGKPQIYLEVSNSYFKINYIGPISGYLIKHGACGTSDTMHQTCNVLTYEINNFLKGKNLKPKLDLIDFKKEGKKFSIGVPFEPSDKSYKLQRRGGMGHDPGSGPVLSEYGNKLGFEGPVRYSSGGVTEYFVTFY